MSPAQTTHRPANAAPVKATAATAAVGAKTKRALAAALNLTALAHELQVRQTALESRNEELRRAQRDLSAARDRFVDLFDFAPVGYLMLQPDGRIAEANLSCAAMLGEDRHPLLGQLFSRFVAPADSQRWREHLQFALQQPATLRIELALQRRSGVLLHAQLDCLRVDTQGRRAGVPAAPMLRVTLADITPRRMAEMDRRIVSQVVQSRETEHRRVARELHEELGQRLSALKMNLSSLREEGDAAPQRIASMLDSLDDAVAMVRRIAGDLRPLMLDDLGLHAAMDWLARDSARRLGLAITLQLDDADPPLDDRLGIALYRLVQATLDHIAHQASATDVGIELRWRPGALVLTVQDNSNVRRIVAGPSRRPAGAALDLHEQAHLLGGQLALAALPGGGQRFSFLIPVPASANLVTPRPAATTP